MRGRLIIHLVHGDVFTSSDFTCRTPIKGVLQEFDADEVKATVERLMQAEGQGTLVLDTGNDEYAIIPTRSINYATIEKEGMQ